LGGGLFACEVDYLRAEEWAVTADDILWRRTKLGLFTSSAEQLALQEFLKQAAPGNENERAA
jgi:glycerol-3-phosphate dehydrogenase